MKGSRVEGWFLLRMEPDPRSHLQPYSFCSSAPSEAKSGPPSLGPFGKGCRGQGPGSFCTSLQKRSQGRGRSAVLDLKLFLCSICTLPLSPILQPKGLREQIPYMLVARGRTKEVSWREVSTVKKELENMPPPTPS